MPFIDLAHRLEYRWHGRGDATRTVVLLHHGLGSVSAWRRFPGRLARRAGCRVLAYSRYGNGRSEPFDEVPRPVDFMHQGARELAQLLGALGVSRPVLVGHSDGASIALIAAGQGLVPVRGLVLLAPHVFVEPLTVASARAAHEQFLEGTLRRKMGRHHRDAERTFRGWFETWTAAAFQGWNIEDALSGVGCPVLVVQGRDDEYGTEEQIVRLRRGLPQPPEVVWFDACGHAPYRDRPEETLEAIRGFVVGVPGDP